MVDFQKTRDAFDLPEGIVYLDGNSLGPLPRAATARVSALLRDEWGQRLIRGWNEAGWMAQPGRTGDRIACLIGAAPDTVTVGDTLSIRLHQALHAALQAAPDRREVLTCSGNFPSDLYIAEGLLRTLDKGHTLRVVPPQEVAATLSDQTAVLMLTEVDYRTGRLHDMARLTRAAHNLGAVTVWDLAHSAGALPVDLRGTNADFAVGCTYKYLNGGPGAPAFLYVRPDRAEQVSPALPGWLGHAAPFEFEPSYRPAPGISRMRIGTPPVIALAALETALDIFDDVAMSDIRARSITLSERFIAGADALGLQLMSPRDPARRGSQVSIAHPEGYAMMQALISRGVIGDFRAPDLMRFGFAPLYNTEADIDTALAHLSDVVLNRLWDNPAYSVRQAVT
ncbi:kynureninase [Algicella marina]|uniref:Kynureninase n=1 Tax=Algicella marina TaxID=2683284 RepID=A0A6P1SWV2_9RHOB|nr:kynureninase [Algicella marina]QHQ34140.1 kynureninase [Algicella marina]